MSREIRRVPANWQHPKKYPDYYDHKKYPDFYLKHPNKYYQPMCQSDYDELIKEFFEELGEYKEKIKLYKEGKAKIGSWITNQVEDKIVTIDEYCDLMAEFYLKESEKEDYKDRNIYYHKQYKNRKVNIENIIGEPPSYPDYKYIMPNGDWWQLFETVSEGTPITPAFATADELVEWLSNNKDFWDTTWTREAAEHIVKTGFAMSGVMMNGNLYRPEEQYLISKNKEI